MKSIFIVVLSIAVGIESALLVKSYQGHWVTTHFAGLQPGDPCFVSNNRIKACLVSLSPEELREANRQVP